MMTTCPECGSNDIVPDLIVFADEAAGHGLVHVTLKEPDPARCPFMWISKEVSTGFRAAICGSRSDLLTRFA